MIVRIVRMTFVPEKTEAFLEIFNGSKSKIRSFPGCHHLELWQDTSAPEVFTTYSHWENEEALEKYRHSELFKNTWAKTKVLFAAKPVAWSSRVFNRVG